MATKGSVGEYICGHCGSHDMQTLRHVNKGNGVERIVLKCNSCKNEDFYDSYGN